MFVVILISIITISFAVQLWLSKPAWDMVVIGTFIPQFDTLRNPSKLFIAISILGATVMPHSLFLHSNMVLTRASEATHKGKQEALHYASLDCSISLFLAFFVNAAILIVAASTFYKNGYREVADLSQAYKLLNPLLGSQYASYAFAIALLAAGLNSTLTGTLSGQIVMEGFMQWSIAPVYRRLVTRILAIAPALVVILIGGDHASNWLLLCSQVVLSFALPFAVLPLIHLTSHADIVGADMVNSQLTTYIAYFIAAVIIALNCMLLVISL